MTHTRRPHTAIVLSALMVLSIVAMSAAFAAPVAASNPTVEETEVQTGGSTITLSGTQTTSLAIDGTDDNVGVQNPSNEDSVDVNNPNEILWQFGETDDYTVTATIVPPEDTSPGDTIDLEVASGQDSETITLTIAEPDPAFLAVSDLDAPATIPQTDTFSVSATVTNEGETEANQDIEFSFDETQIATEPVTIEGGASETVLFDLPTDTRELGTYEYSISSENDTSTGSVEIVEPQPPSLSVSNLEAPDSVIQGEQFSVSATLTNDGDIDAAQEVVLEIDGLEVESEPVTLAGGATQQRTITTTAPALTPGTYEYTVRSENDSMTDSIEIQPEIHESGVDQQVFNAVADDQGNLGVIELSMAIETVNQEQQIDGVDISVIDLSQLITWVDGQG